MMTIVPLNKVGIRCNSLRETRNLNFRIDNCEKNEVKLQYFKV